MVGTTLLQAIIACVPKFALVIPPQRTGKINVGIKPWFTVDIHVADARRPVTIGAIRIGEPQLGVTRSRNNRWLARRGVGHLPLARQFKRMATIRHSVSI